MTLPLPLKLVGETLTMQFNFLTQLEWGETLSVPVVTVEVFSGLDYAPEDMLSGTASVLGAVVSQKIQQGLAGVIYNLVCTATGSTGNVYKVVRPLAVLDPDGQFQAGAVPTLTGILPDGVVGAAYSAPLTISGGYPPYFPDGIASGTAPSWMFFSVVDNTLHCTGLPDELTGPTNYIFSPQIVDSVGGQANAPQNITITRITITGDLGNGDIGDPVNYQYVIDNGTPPYTATIIGGSLPPGTSMSTSGLVTGTYTTAGIYTWTVQAVDVNGVIATLLDGNEVGAYEIFARQNTTGTTTLDIGATFDPEDWSGQPSLISTASGTARHLMVGQETTLISYAQLQGRISTNRGLSFTPVTMILAATSGYKGKFIGTKYWVPLGGASGNGLAWATTPGSWTTVPTNTSTDQAIAGVPGLLVRGGIVVGAGNGVNTSFSINDGVSWSAPLSGLKRQGVSASATIQQLETNGTIIIAVGQDFALAWTSNGSSWTQITSPFTSGSGTPAERRISCIAYGNVAGVPMWICGTNSQDDSPVGQIAYSLSGTDGWTLAADTLGTNINDCIIANGVAIVVGDGGRIKTSVNGANWTTRTSNFGSDNITSIVKMVP